VPVFEFTLGQPAVADNDSMRDANEFRVRELHTRARVTTVEQDLELLIERGATLDARSVAGYSALNMAQAGGHDHAVWSIREWKRLS